MAADLVELLTYMKALLAEVHALRREQMLMSVRLDDLRARFEGSKSSRPPPPLTQSQPVPKAVSRKMATVQGDTTGVRRTPIIGKPEND